MGFEPAVSDKCRDSFRQRFGQHDRETMADGLAAQELEMDGATLGLNVSLQGVSRPGSILICNAEERENNREGPEEKGSEEWREGYPFVHERQQRKAKTGRESTANNLLLPGRERDTTEVSGYIKRAF